MNTIPNYHFKMLFQVLEMDVIDSAWKTLRTSDAQIMKTLFNNGLIPVPKISTANSFGLFSVFIKPKVGPQVGTAQ